MKLTSPLKGVLVALALVSLGVSPPAAQGQGKASDKPRLVITADPELDDVNTLIRAILYTTDFKLEGLIYDSSQFHWRGDDKGSTQYIAGREYARYGHGPVTSWRWPDSEKFIDEIVDAYGQVYRNLGVHNPAYPAPAEIKAKIKWGNVEFEGDYSKDSDGSNLIKSLLLDNQPGPLFVAAQGGQSTIARALKSIYDQYAKTSQWTAIQDKVSRKLIIIPWGDQDGTNSRYIRPNWPGVETWTLAMINFGYGARGSHTPDNQRYLGGEWTRENVSSRGPLGSIYRVWGDGKRMSKADVTDHYGLTGFTSEQLRGMGYNPVIAPGEKGSFISEGDTPTFLNLLDNGLRGHEHGLWGGWGGRRRTDTAAAGRGGAPAGTGVRGPGTPVGPDDPGIGLGIAPAGSTANAPASAASDGGAPSGRGQGRGTGGGGGGGRGQQMSSRTALVNAKFFAAAQHDFAARMKWSVTPRFRDANHEPRVVIKGPLAVSARPGATVRLAGQVSDPDRDPVTVNWWQYHDAGTYPGNITFARADTINTTFEVPADAQTGQTIHVIVEATDRGTPALTRYQRVVVTVQ
jgi:hypothetical protein